MGISRQAVFKTVTNYTVAERSPHHPTKTFKVDTSKLITDVLLDPTSFLLLAVMPSRSIRRGAVLHILDSYILWYLYIGVGLHRCA